MASMFIVVVDSDDDGIYMKQVLNEHDVLHLAGGLASDEEVKSVFEIDTKGHVTHHNIKFDGRLKLVAVLMPMEPTPAFNKDKLATQLRSISESWSGFARNTVERTIGEMYDGRFDE